MTGGLGAKDAPRPFTDEELAAIDAYLPELRRSVAGQRILYTSLVIGFVVGLAAHVGGYVLRSSATTEPAGLVLDLLYALGWALWTGVVVVVFVQVVPETNGVKSCGGSMPTRQRCAIRPEPEVTRRRAVRRSTEHSHGTDGRNAEMIRPSWPAGHHSHRQRHQLATR
jgi:hypothetical protein